MEDYIIANQTDKGKTREINEDSLITFDSQNGRVIAVCDGMGGQVAGNVASNLACSIIHDILEDNVFSTPSEAITKAMMAANQGILHRAAQDPSLEGMGTTCVMLIIKDGLVYFGWVGDSRIYYISNHHIRQLSKDQSYVQQLIDRGEITPQQAATHPRKNEITNALGVEGMTPPQLGQPIRPEPGSILLLCSDGLSGMVSNEKIEQIASKTEIPLGERAKKLVDLANENGGLDNITVQLVEFPKKKVPDTKKWLGLPSTLVIAFGAVMCLLIAAWMIWGFPSHGEPKKNTPATSDHRTNTNQKSTQETPKATSTAQPKPKAVSTTTETPTKPTTKPDKKTDRDIEKENLRKEAKDKLLNSKKDNSSEVENIPDKKNENGNSEIEELQDEINKKI